MLAKIRKWLAKEPPIRPPPPGGSLCCSRCGAVESLLRPIVEFSADHAHIKPVRVHQGTPVCASCSAAVRWQELLSNAVLLEVQRQFDLRRIGSVDLERVKLLWSQW